MHISPVHAIQGLPWDLGKGQSPSPENIPLIFPISELPLAGIFNQKCVNANNNIKKVY